MRRVLASIAVLALAVAAPARAAEVRVAGSELTFVAADDETNVVDVTAAGADLVVDDLGSDLVAGDGCTEGPGDVVTCSPQGGAPSFTRQTFDLGDRGDFLSLLAAVPATVDGGTGGDELEGSPAADTIEGGPGSDALTGGGGVDTLLGGAGGDDLAPGADGAGDDVRGGTGRDRVTYLEPLAVPHVRVSLDGVADDGFAALGETDNVHADVEDVATGDGDDVVTGSAAANIVDTGAGADVVAAGDGTDSVFTGPGADQLDGGPGADTLVGGADSDQVSGGAGNDTLENGAGSDVLDGGDGADTARFATSDPVAVSLDGVANDGAAGEGDNALVENVITGSGPDVVTGDAARNLIATGGGDDTITVTGDDAVDSVGCGTGNDTVAADPQDDVAQLGTDDKCETINGSPVDEEPPVVRVQTPLDDRRAAQVRLSRCPPAAISKRTFRRGVACTANPDEAVRMTITLVVGARSAVIARAGEVVLAERRTARSSRTRRIRLRPPDGALRGNRSFRARLRVVAVDDGGNRTVRADAFRVRR